VVQVGLDWIATSYNAINCSTETGEVEFSMMCRREYGCRYDCISPVHTTRIDGPVNVAYMFNFWCEYRS